jgi:hypothetical protein
MRFTSLRYGIISLILILFVSCSSQETKTTDDSLSSALPGKSELTGFAQTTTPIAYSRDKAWDHLGSSSDKFLYNGFQRGAIAQYASDDKTRKLSLEVLQFSDPIRAFAIYSFLRPPFSKAAEVAPLGCIGRDTLLFVKGVHVGRVIGSSPTTENDMLMAAKVVLGKLSDSVMLPVQVGIFPHDGMIPNTETVTLDDIEGQNWNSNLFGVQYLFGADTAHVYLRLGTDDGPTVAVKRFLGGKGLIKNYLMDCGYQALTGQDESGRYVLCAVDKQVLCTVVGKVDQKTAQGIVDKIFAAAAKVAQK